jgi:hypothetical protein
MAERAQESITGTPRARVTSVEHKRILALAIRTGMFGFAVIESPSRLLDWGMRRFEKKRSSGAADVSARIRPLLKLHKPRLVVIRSREYHSAAFNRRLAASLRSIRREAKRLSIGCRMLTPSEVQQHLSPDRRVTKYQIAASLAERFKALSWKLPPLRKKYQSESLVSRYRKR